MDYDEWLLDYYNLKIAPLTNSEGFADLVGLIMAGTLFTTFADQIIGFYENNFLGDTMPVIKETYTTSFYEPIDLFIEDTLSPFFLENVGEQGAVVINVIDQVWEGLNYFIIDVVLAWLNGDLTSDPDYA